MTQEKTLPEGWIPLSEAYSFLLNQVAFINPRFAQEYGNRRYIDIRFDLHTGKARLQFAKEADSEQIASVEQKDVSK